VNVKDWEQIKKIALVGVDHLSLSASTLSQLEQLGIEVEDQSEVQSILEAIAYLTQLEQAKLPVEPAISPIPQLSFSTKDEIRWLSNAAVQHIAVLFSYHQPAFPEFSALAQVQQRYLPPEYIPVVMPHVKAQPTLWQYVAPLLEEQAKWLMQQHHFWAAWLKKPIASSSSSQKKSVSALQKLKAFQDSLHAGRSFMDQAEWQQLKTGAYQVDINQLKTFQQAWQLERIQHSMWRGNVRQLDKILRFRQSMCASFEY
jgi:hypothetical protein